MKHLMKIIGILIGLSSQSVYADEIQTADVFVTVCIAQQEVEFLRHYMGRHLAYPPHTLISNAAPREVYYQALALLRGTGRLSKERTGQRFQSPKELQRNIHPDDVNKIVKLALKNIRSVKETLGLKYDAKAVVRDETKTPSDVFRAISKLNKQVNLLLEYVVSPTDVFEKVKLAVLYSAKIIGKPIKKMPYECCKMPSDVYLKLVEAYQLINKLAHKHNIETLHLELKLEKDINPDEVYDLAMLIISELSYISQSSGLEAPNTPYYEGRKFPADVYQQEMALLFLLNEEGP